MNFSEISVKQDSISFSSFLELSVIPIHFDASDSHSCILYFILFLNYEE